jgi:hypothetical protein
MPIPLTCHCGFELEIPNSLEGKQTRCPSCRRVLSVPYVTVLPVDGDLPEVLPVDPATAPAMERSPDNMPLPAADVRERERRARAQERRDHRRGRRDPAPIAFEEGWFSSINGGVVGGALTVVIGLGWLIVGMALGRVFIYALFLIVIGFVSIVVGLNRG